MAPGRGHAIELDRADPLAGCVDRFVAAPGVLAYLDGNSLGRPVADLPEQLTEFVRGPWGTSLIRSWTDPEQSWMTWPEETGDQLGAVVLGAAAGQCVVADSTTVLLYKLLRALADHQLSTDPARTQVVLDTDNFPTDRYVAEGVAAERGLELVWIDSAAHPERGVRLDEVLPVLGERTAVVLLSHVAYRSGWVADAAAITTAVHRAGALVLWDLSHSAGSVPLHLDDWGADAAVGCGYKYLSGGPGAPAFAYLARRLHDLPTLRQPVQGWMGRRDPFAMGPGYQPAGGVRALVSGTPPVVGMVPLRASLAMLSTVGMAAVRAKSLLLTDYAWQLVEQWDDRLAVQIASPREHERRGGHLTLGHPRFRDIIDQLWARGVIPDFREPDGLRLGLAPLSTRFTEVHDGLAVVHDLLAGSVASGR